MHGGIHQSGKCSQAHHNVLTKKKGKLALVCSSSVFLEEKCVQVVRDKS